MLQETVKKREIRIQYHKNKGEGFSITAAADQDEHLINILIVLEHLKESYGIKLQELGHKKNISEKDFEKFCYTVKIGDLINSNL